jgi:UDP-hydrolysing UDP-N-acetyl-D-glucosamine 2-epimerase
MSNSTRRIAVLTTGRQDWGLLRSSCEAMQAEGLEVVLLAGGMHLSRRHGRTIDQIRVDGFEPVRELDWMLPESDDEHDPHPERQAGLALELVGRALREENPDALLLAGDRFETAAAALAATVNRVPLIHLHGGEQTGGAFDDQLRHSISKLSHLHLVSHEEHARRLEAMGEDPSTIHVVGAPGLDSAFRPDIADRAEIEAWLGIPLSPPVVIVTVHPATLDPVPSAVVQPVLAAMREVLATYVVTLPNSDPGADEIRSTWHAATASLGSGHTMVVTEALGERRYWGLMRIADAMLGNSSSALIEAPAVDLPAVNVGDRQAGRHREGNVIDAASDIAEVVAALRMALEPATKNRIRASHPAIADGRAGQRVAAIIAGWHPDRPPRKRPIRLNPGEASS